MKEPNFFIIGAPKCGTTALYEYLKDHPEIYMSTPKEPHYFSTDFPSKSATFRTKDSYLKGCFTDVKPHHKAVGEASVWYLFSKTAIRNIKEFNPDARIIVMLRNPVDMVYSLHSQMRHSFYEDEKDFEKAWVLQETRKKGQKLPRRCNEVQFLQYFDVACFAAQLERVYEQFPQKQVKIIFFDDFCANPRQVYHDVLRFLEVSDDQRRDFSVVNANKEHRLYTLGNFLSHPPKFITAPIFKLKAIIGIKRLGVLDFFIMLNRQMFKRKPLSSDMKKVLIEVFKDEVVLLEKLTERNLSDWKK